ncbi:MAG: ribonuclease D, partial [Mariprofundaceae bacterium]|nr:ribonuclease D [Mariprofundaceae bacterium]
DTEFHREKTYRAQFALLQVGCSEASYIIDPVQIKDLQAIWDVLLDSNILKVFHAGRQDLEIILEHAGALPLPMFDTQVAAALLGYGQQVGFGNLVQRIVKKELAKGESFSDWLGRPLTSQQLTYAADDVIYLMPIYHALKEQLQARKRDAWLDEEQAILTNINTYHIDQQQVFWRVKGVNKLKPRHLAVLRELAAWREAEVQRKDMPRRRLISDDVLLEIAKRDQLTPDVMARMRGLSTGMIKRYGSQLLKLWQQGIDCPEEDYPKLPARKHNTTGTDLRLELLDTLLRLKAEESSISATILASKSDLACLASWGHKRQGEQPDIACLQGWRLQLVGNDLLRLLHGQICLRLDPDTGLPVIDDYQGETS